MKLLNLVREKTLNNSFFIGTLVMVVGSNIYNAGQFLYHIVAGRILGPAYYGDLAALIGILAVFALIQISIGLTIVKFIASEQKENKISGLIQWALYWSSLIGLAVAILLAVASQFISSFLHLSQPNSIYFLAPIIFLYAVVNITRSVLQGLLKFISYVASLLTEIGVKLILMIPLVLAGYAVNGAMTALLIGVFISLFIGIFSLRKYLWTTNSQKPTVAPLIKYSVPAFMQGIALTSMYSTDLFLVKHFFSPETAGLYAALAKLGSIVFFAASPIAQVMFPLVAKKHAHGEPYHKIFYLSVLLVAIIASLIVLAYALAPSVFLSALGPSFLEGASILWWFGVFMGFLALSMLFIQFYLSVGKTFVVGLFLGSAILQATLIWFFHESLLMVIQMSIISAALLAVSLFIYFPYHDKK